MDILRNWKLWIWVVIIGLVVGLVYLMRQADQSTYYAAADVTPFYQPSESEVSDEETPAPVVTAASTQAINTPAPSVMPTATPGPQPKTYLISFAGDCTLGSQDGSQAAYTFPGVVGDDYGWPFRLVQDYFANDTLTIVNLEGTFTTSRNADDKQFRFKGDPRYVACLTEGSVEAVSTANNHIKDYQSQGMKDTLDTLDSAGVLAATFTDPAIFTADDGFRIGIIAGYYPNVETMQKQYDKCQEEKCDVTVAVIHMGNEYYYQPTGGQKRIAKACIDMGCSIVVMHHPHVLQPIEYYNGKAIVYSLGNFAFGGNANPRDKDTAIVQLPVIVDPDGTITLGSLVIVPCSISSGPRNNYQPKPLSEDDPAYARVLSKLDGTYKGKNGTAATEKPEVTPQPTQKAGDPTEAPSAAPTPTSTANQDDPGTDPGTSETPISSVTATPASQSTDEPQPTPAQPSGDDPGQPSDKPSDDQPIFGRALRFYNPNSSEHFYTIDRKEAEALKNAGWNDEGDCFNYTNEGTPVYRVYNPNLGDHFFTADLLEARSCIKAGWSDETVGWNAVED